MTVNNYSLILLKSFLNNLLVIHVNSVTKYVGL